MVARNDDLASAVPQIETSNVMLFFRVMHRGISAIFLVFQRLLAAASSNRRRMYSELTLVVNARDWNSKAYL